jgi:hypothetical protein
MRNGVIAGSIAAIVVALVSLPLRSPADNVFNTATVGLASLVVGFAAGLLWDKLGESQRRPMYHAGALALGLTAVVVIAVLGEIWLNRSVSFIVPLALIAFGLSGVLVPVLSGLKITTPSWAAPAVLVIAAVIGIGLVGQGDGESGDLSLPERVGSGVSGDGLHFLVTDGSEITFTVGEKLSRLPLPSDAVVRTEALSGQLYLDEGSSQVTVELLTLSSDQDFRDGYIRTRMFQNSPVAVFTVEDLDDLPLEFFSGETFTRQVTGSLNVNGGEFPLTFDLEVRNDGDVLNILGRTVFTWDQLGIRVPNIRNIVSVEDEVSVQLLLVAEPN